MYFLVGLVVVEPCLLGLLASEHGDVKKGAKLFESKCAHCHTANDSGLTKAETESPWYSQASSLQSPTLKETRHRVSLSPKHMMVYLIPLTTYIVGTKMVIAGTKKEQ